MKKCQKVENNGCYWFASDMSTKYILCGSINPSEDWDLDSYVAKVYLTLEEMLSDVERIANSGNIILPYAKSLPPIQMPWTRPCPTDPIATVSELLDSLKKYIGAGVGEFMIGKFYLVASDPRSICQLSVVKSNVNHTVSLPDRYLRVLSEHGKL